MLQMIYWKVWKKINVYFKIRVNNFFFLLYIYIYIYMYYMYVCVCVCILNGHFIRYTLLVPGWTPFCLQNCLKELETFLRDFVPYCCRFVGCISMMWISCSPPHTKGALLDWDLVTVEAIWVKWTHCNVKETSLRWFELCDMVHYPSGSIHQNMFILQS